MEEGVCDEFRGTSLAVQWLRLHTQNAGGPVSTPWSSNYILLATNGEGPCTAIKTQHGQKQTINNTQYTSQFILLIE